jgi:hypothetical protein
MAWMLILLIAESIGRTRVNRFKLITRLGGSEEHIPIYLRGEFTRQLLAGTMFSWTYC